MHCSTSTSTFIFLLLAISFSCVIAQSKITVPQKYSTSLNSRNNRYSDLNDVAKHWKILPAQENDIITLTFAMKLQNEEDLHNIFKRVSDPSSRDYGKYLSLEEVNQLTAPDSFVINEMESFLKGIDVHNIEKTQGGDFIMATMSIQQAKEFLLTSSDHITKYIHFNTGHVAYYTESQIVLPHSIGQFVDFVSGFEGPSTFESNLNPVTTPPSSSDTKDPNAINVNPKVIKKLYNITRSGQSSSNLQCVVSFLEQYFSHSDLKKFYSRYLLPQHLPEKIIGKNDDSDPGVEASLDVQYLMGVATSVPTYVWYTSGRHKGQEPFIKWLTDVSNTNNIPYVFSISYQDYEDTLSREWTSRVNSEFIKLASRGATVVTGSGDWGVGCSNDCKHFRPDFPSSSPYIVSTGATFVYRNSNYFMAEQGVKFSSGGFSNYFERPEYQNNAVSGFLQKTDVPTSFFNNTGRGFPDVSAAGLKFQVVYKDRVIPVAGTSAATPTFAAVLSLINEVRLQNGKPTLGHVNPFLYQAATYPASFSDITKGSNEYECCPGFKCTKGWDPMTGLGTPNYGILAELAMSKSIFPHLDQF